MSEKINSLTRIKKIMEALNSNPNEGSKINKLATAFEMNILGVETDQLVTSQNVLKKLFLLKQEVEKAEQKINDEAKKGVVVPAVFEPVFKHIRTTLFEPAKIFEQLGQILSPEQIGLLGMGSQLLDHEEDLITEELNTLKNEIIDFWRKISKNNELPHEVKTYVLEQLSHILTAIEDYKIIGIRVFQNNYPNFFATVVRNNETIKNDKTTLELTKQIDGFWKKGFSYANKAQKTITEIKGYLGTGEDVGEISQKIIDLF